MEPRRVPVAHETIPPAGAAQGNHVSSPFSIPGTITASRLITFHAWWIFLCNSDFSISHGTDNCNNSSTWFLYCFIMASFLTIYSILHHQYIYINFILYFSICIFLFIVNMQLMYLLSWFHISYSRTNHHNANINTILLYKIFMIYKLLFIFCIFMIYIFLYTSHNTCTYIHD